MGDISGEQEPSGIGRRRFLGYVLAASTLTVAAQLGEGAAAPRAEAAVPGVPEPADLYDLNDMLTDATLATANLITITVNADGTASFALPRTEVGQGITTSTAMLIAEELDLPLDKVQVSLADARPELLFNQLTGGSNTTISTYTPVRVAAATAKQQLLEAAATELGVPLSALSALQGVITAPDGRSLSYAELAVKAASLTNLQVSVTLKPASAFSVIGTPQNRIDALDAVTGRKKFAMDVQVPNAMPAMICRPPTINGTVVSVQNQAVVAAMPGITDVAVVSTGVAVRGRTFGQCIDAVRALQVTWGPGSEDAATDATVLAELRAAENPLVTPPLPLLTAAVDARFTFHFASNSALESNCAVADVRSGSAEIWASVKAPITAQEEIAAKLGLPVGAVTVHVTQGGGSFGRKLFHDAALEAAEVSQAMGKPVRLMWHRTDDFRHGRAHPMSISRVRATYSLGQVLTLDQRHTSVATEFGHGLGEIITAEAAKLPVGGLTFSETIFSMTQQTPYNFGVTTQLLTEVDNGFHTGSMRNIYSPNVRCAQELIVDRLAAAMNQDPYHFRRGFLKDQRAIAVLDKVAQEGNWGRTMAPGTAQGIAIHPEYHGFVAILAEIDCTPATVNRQIPDAVTGPRVTKVVCAVDVGLAVNPKGLEAQMMGGIMDGIAVTLTSSLHLNGGYFQEGSWDNYFYTRQWNTPPELDIYVMPPTTGTPGGAGELAVAGSMAAVACAYGRATGTMPTTFPINHDAPLAFTPLPTVPPIPQSPTDGLSRAY
ncbi:xanthine dehydrogenase family protein molybdopterin-binding subunit [Streptacidiphilus pinicola]|uniref:Xanthine dehydrogenase family protein molybdopterin-binding subunit n=1 Tax=Streptacidiphilus pinicola TaxID=2219663 RepID=A0A2X0K7C6_9ACTN|nr:molybdopterin cofactor-binding domain-containing protein [Streptacidiphilus pinicola]RAG83429.1 xanthine dehydrogenase family protein molybdopterin-binding subunit [Streptacidiphilus pinicola]